jgi:thioredoxin reductase
MDRCFSVAIVGAGPYGLSIAAHLAAQGIDYSIFGRPMQPWRENMPNGMLLKSDGFASNLSDPASTFTLQRFCEMTATPYDHTRLPVSLESFKAYGLAFQERLVPKLEDKQVVRLEPATRGYKLHFDDGRAVLAKVVVLAVGISHFKYVPSTLLDLPESLVSHASAHREFGQFCGREVAVIGGGASAIDIAVFLREAGANVTVIARRSLRINDPPSQSRRSLWEVIRRPRSPIGPGWRSRIYSDAPWLIHALPRAVRERIVRDQVASPSAGWPMKERFVGKVPTLEGYTVQRAWVNGNRVRLGLQGANGDKEHVADHVIAATGYRVDLRRLTFLGEKIRSQIESHEYGPVLSATFESSVPGLYFVGLASMGSFGPLMRFACGAAWTARRISRWLASLSLVDPVLDTAPEGSAARKTLAQ